MSWLKLSSNPFSVILSYNELQLCENLFSNISSNFPSCSNITGNLSLHKFLNFSPYNFFIFFSSFVSDILFLPLPILALYPQLVYRYIIHYFLYIFVLFPIANKTNHTNNNRKHFRSNRSKPYSVYSPKSR